MCGMQETLKAHTAGIEGVPQGLQEALERCHRLAEDIAETREHNQAKLDTKADSAACNGTCWGGMQEALKAHDARVEAVSQGLHE
eukprot:11173824-Lingulodinium_polyedra.AAC.1